MIHKKIPATVRADFGKGAARQLRRDAKTPAILYSNGKDALALQLDAGVLYKNLFEIHGRNAVVTLDIEGDQEGERHVMVREIQQDPVTEQVLHVDFQQISLENSLVVSVPLDYQGTAKGVDFGGLLKIVRSSVSLKGQPLDIPDVIEINIEQLEQGGEGIICGDLPLPDKVEMMDDHDGMCVSVL